MKNKIRKIKEMIDTFDQYKVETRMFIIAVFTASTTLLMLAVYYLGQYFGVLLLSGILLFIAFGDSIISFFQERKNPTGSCSCCIGCDAIYPAVLTAVYDALKVVSPILHFAIPPTERQIQSICPPRADGLPRWAFRVMKRNEGDPVSDEDVLCCFRQTLADSFAAHSNDFICSGVRNLYVESVKQDGFSVTFFIMPYCPSCTASYIDRMQMRDQVRKDRETQTGEEHIYDDQI